MPHNLVEFILYVRDQQKSASFYSILLDKSPSLNVPGMTEFELGNGVKLGLMPNDGIQKILNGMTPHPASGDQIPRCEIYLHVENLTSSCARAIAAGAKEVSPAMTRDWGDTVAYFADPDGHIVALVHREQEL